MSLSHFLHDPTWLKVHAAEAVGASGLLVLLAQRLLVVRKRKRDINKPAVLLAETYGTEISEPAPQEQAQKQTAGAQGVAVHRSIAGIAISIACIVVSATSLLFALSGYIVLSNWQEGLEKTYIGDPVGAIICYRKALRADPTLHHTHLLIGEALFSSGRARAAIPEIRIAADGADADSEALAVLGDVYQALNMPSEAISAYQRAAAKEPGEAQYQMVIGTCHEKLHQWHEAIDAYENALTLNPAYTLAHIRIGILLANNGRRDEGLAHCKKAAALTPNSVLAHNSLGTLYAQSGDLPNAFEEYRKTVELNPKFLIGQVNLGLTLERMNAPERALAQFRACLKVPETADGDKKLIVLVKSEIHRLESSLTHKS